MALNQYNETYAAYVARRQAELAETAIALTETIRREVYPTSGGREGFLTDPGGWIDYFNLTDDDDLATEAVGLIETETVDASD